MRPVRVYGRTADCGPFFYPDCGDCGGRDEMLLVCSSYVSVLSMCSVFCSICGGSRVTKTSVKRTLTEFAKKAGHGRLNPQS